MGNKKYFLEEDKELVESIKLALKKAGKTQVDLAIELRLPTNRLNRFLTNAERLPAVLYIKIVRYINDARKRLREESSSKS